MTIPRPLRCLYLLMMFAAIGAVAGAAVGWLEVRSHAYLPLGMERNAYLTLQAPSAVGASLGAVLALLVLAAHYATPHLAPAVRRSIGAAVGRARLLPYVLVLAGAVLTVALLPMVRLSVRPLRVWGLVASIGLWLLVRPIWWRFWSHGKWRRLFRLLFDLAPAVLFIGVLLLDRYRLSQLLDPKTAVGAGGLLLAAVAYASLAFRQPGRAGGLPAWAWLGVLPLALPAVLALAINGVGRLAPQDSRALKNVVLIAIDTLRWDHSPAGGDADIEREVTPNLARLARQGTVFRTAISQAPWTLPAFSSILTGKYPRQHGAYSVWSALGKSEVTLAEALREAGYRTGAVVSHVYVDAAHGFGQGFDTFDDSNVLGEWKITSRTVTDKAVGLVRRFSGDPFFMFVHYFDPHNEYRNHPEVQWADRYSNWLSRHRLDIWTLLRYRHALDAADLGYLRDLYREEVAFTDTQIGRLLDEIEQRGLRDSTAIVVVADHGEEFMEHGWIGHSVSLHDELLRVPLIVTLPTGEGSGTVVDRTVETRSVYATVLDLLDVASPTGGTDGPSLLPLIAAGGASGSENRDAAAFSEIRVPDAAFTTGKREIQAAVRRGGWKLVLDIERDRTRLFDLSADPGEQVDVSATEPQRAAELRHLLDDWLAEMDASAAVGVELSVDEKTLGLLRALGYV